MRLFHPRWLLALTLAAAACSGPTDEDIDTDLEQQISSVAGVWAGDAPTLALDFELTEGPGTAVSGSGTMREASAPAKLPITVTGTFQRPKLSLTISGMTYEGKAVQGTFQGNYTTAGGVSGPLHLVGTGYSKNLTVLLQER
jgi:hypothetical protein